MTPLELVAENTHKLWGGRFAGRTSPIMDAVNRSIGVVFRLWPFDVRLSKAWADGMHSNLGITSVYMQGIDSGEIIETVHARREPMLHVSASLRL